MISNGWDLTKINIADTESTERRFFLVRSGDDDRAKPRRPFGNILPGLLTGFRSEAAEMTLHARLATAT